MKTRSIIATCLSMLVFMTGTSTSFAARKKRSDRDDINIFYFLKNMIGFTEYKATEKDAKRTDLLLIGAGFGRTGTTSYMTALEEIGLQSYHMKGVVGSPGHLELWVQYLTERRENNGQASKETANKLIDALALAGFDATASMPACFLVEDLMARYPEAKVVMTVRGDGNGQAWAKSMLNTVANINPAIQRVPFRWVPRLQTFSKMFHLMLGEIGAPVNATTGLPNRDDLANGYEAWVAHVQSVVPSDRLLPFAAQSGWKPLCDFLSPVDSGVQEACQEILESGDSYPRVNDTANVQRMLKALSTISWPFEHPLQLLMIGALLVLSLKRLADVRTVIKMKRE